MTRKRSSPMGLDMYLPILLAFIMLPLLAQAAPFQDYTEIQQYTEGCYYNYNHYNEGDRIITNEPCLNCTCHNKMLMCYLRVCPFTKPIGHDCIVEKREDQCCPIITCPEVPVDVAHPAPEPGTELTFPEKFGCSIDGKFYLEGAQVPSNPNKPCELCYCIKNRTSCLMQECTLHIDGCTPIYNRGSCCPVRYNCDHENDVLELEDHSTTTEVITTTTTERPTTGFVITSTMIPSVSTDCVHNNELYADGARIAGETACENCYCMRGDIVCAVQECHMPILKDNGKLCHPLPATEGECCPSNYACEDDTTTTQVIEDTTLPYSGLDEQVKISTAAPVKDLHSAIPEEDLQLQTHIDEEETATKAPATEGPKDKKDTDAEIVNKPASTDDEDTKQESTITNVASDETTTASPLDVESIESEESLTTTSTISDKLPETSTEVFKAAENADNTETNEKTETEDSAQNGETVTKVPTADGELSETSAISDRSDEEYATVTTKNIKPETIESVTKISTTDIESKFTTVSTATKEEASEETTQSTNEIKAAAAGDYTTQAPSVSEVADLSAGYDNENKTLESGESVTETDKIFTESSTTTEEDHEITESPLDVKNTAQSVEGEHTETIASSSGKQEDDLGTTESIINEPSKNKFDDLSTEYPTSNIAGEPIDTKPEEQETSSTEDIAPTTQSTKEEDLSIEEPKENDKLEDFEREKEENVTILPNSSYEPEESTAYVDENELLHSNEISVQFEGSERVTTLPTPADEDESSASTTPKIGENKEEEASTDYVSTTPIDIDSVPSKKDPEGSSEEFANVTPVPDAKQEFGIITDAPSKSKDATTVSNAEDKPIFDEELGSGDYATEVISSETPTVILSNEAVTSISEEREEEESTTTKATPSSEDKPEEQTTSNDSEESSESEDDGNLMYLTTAKPSETSATTSSSSASDKTTEVDKKDILTEDETDITTTATPLDEKLPTDLTVEHDDKLFEEEDAISSTPNIVGESEKSDSNSEADKKQDINKEFAGSENVTTQKTIEEQEQQTSIPSTVATITDGEQDVQKLLPEHDDHIVEEQSVVTDNPLAIIDNISSYTTTKSTAQIDIGTEPSTNPEEEQKIESNGIPKPSLDVKGDIVGHASTTTNKPFADPSRAAETPDMQLPSAIPGEGDCLIEKMTYKHNTIVPTSDECEVVCKCISSIVTCERVKCDIPDNIEKCILDATSTNKCCPTYICNNFIQPSKSEESVESIEEDEVAQNQFTTASYEISTERIAEEPNINKSEITTTKPTYEAVSIPEIEMPAAITIEPMSHVKDEEEFEQQTTKSPIAEEKKDLLIDHSSTTPSDLDEEIAVSQSMAPSEISKQETQEKVIEKNPEETAEKEAVTDPSIIQEELKKVLGDQTAITHEFGESFTESTVKITSGKEEEIYSTSTAQTETQTSMPTSLGEEVKEPETQTDRKISNESTELPIESNEDKDDIQEPESETSKPIATSEFSSLAPPVDEVSKVQEEIETTSIAPNNEVKLPTPSPEPEEKHTSTEDNIRDISDSITTKSPGKDQDVETDINRTTILPSSDNFTKESSTIKQPSGEIGDHNIPFESLDKELESTSTIASYTEEAYDLTTIDNIDYTYSEKEHKNKENIKPDGEGHSEQEIEFSTIVPEAGDESLVENVTPAAGDISEHTVSPIISDEHREATEESITTEVTINKFSNDSQEETQNNIGLVEDHTISPEFGKKNEEKESHTTSIPVLDEQISDHTTAIVSESTDINTDKPIGFETKTDTSSLSPPSIDISTTITSDIGKNDENKSSEEDHAIYSTNHESVGQQTLSAGEMTDSRDTTIENVTDSTEDENTTMSSVEHVEEDVGSSVDREEIITKSTFTSNAFKPQEDIDHTTTVPLTINEHTTETIISEKEDVFEDNKTAESITAKQPSSDLFEEASGESAESEEEASIKPLHIGEFVTQRVDEEEEKEASGEEDEEDDNMEAATVKPHKTTPETVTLEQVEMSHKNETSEVPTDKILEEDSGVPNADIATKTAIESEDAPYQTTGKDTISTVTEAPLVQQNTEQQEEDIAPSADEKVFDISTEQPKEVTTFSNERSGSESMTTTQQYDNKVITASEFETVTVEQEESFHDVNKSDEIGHITEKPEEEDIKPSTVESYLRSDEIQHVTTEYSINSEDMETATDKHHENEEDKFAVTRSPVSSADIDFATVKDISEEESDVSKDIEITTTKLQTYETSDASYSHTPTEEIEQSKGEDIETTTPQEAEQLDIGTSAPVESIDMTTLKPLKEVEAALDVKSVPETLEVEATTAKLPDYSHESFDLANTEMQTTTEVRDEDRGNDSTEDHTTQAATAIQHEVSQYVTESSIASQPEKGSYEDITENSVSDEAVTVKLPDIMEQVTELTSKDTQSDKDESQNVTSNAPDDLTEKVNELTTKYTTSDEEHFEETTSSHVSTERLPEVSENVTELPKTDTETEKEVKYETSTSLPYDELPEQTSELPFKPVESDEDATELAIVAEISTVKSQEHDSQLPTKEMHPEDEKIFEHVTELPAKDIEYEKESHEISTELSVDANITTEKLLAHTTDLPVQSHEEDKKGEITKTPEDVYISTEILSEHITELPTPSKESEGEVHVPADKTPEHVTELPNKDTEPEEDLYDESADKLPPKNIESGESHDISTEMAFMAHEDSTYGHVADHTTENAYYTEESSTKTSTEVPEDVGEIKLHSSTATHPLFSHHTTLSSLAIDSRIDDTTSQSTPIPDNKEETYTTPTTTTVSTTTTEAATTPAPHYQPQPPIYGQPPQYGPTQYEDEYTDEDEGEVFGPGTCRYGGKLYVSAQQIPRDDPCDFCFCFRSDIICLQQSCPPPIAGCHEEPISGFCCPRYECPVSMATVLNITTSTTTTSTTLPPHFLHHSYGNNAQRTGCLINGRSYRVGEKVESTSGPCINCTCGGDGKMKCDPQACVPEPTMQQVMAVVAAGRKR